MAAAQTVEVRAQAQSTPTLAARVSEWLRDPWMWIVALVMLAAVALSTPDLTVPLNRDEGAFLAIAQRILQGQVPYRDVFDQKSPAIYYYLAGVLALTSPLGLLQRIVVARIGVVLVDMVAGLGIYLLGQRWWSREVGLLAAIFWFLAVPLYNGDQFFTEPFATAATVWALVVADRWPALRGAFVAGLLLALASLFKQTAILAFPGVAIVALAAGRGAHAWWRPSWQAARLLGALIAGAVLPWLVVLAAFAAVGGVGPLFDQVVMSNLVHYPPDPWSGIVSGVRSSLDAFRLIWLGAGLAMVVGAIRWVAQRRMPSPGALALTAAFIFSLVPFRSHAYNHYFLQLVPTVALLSAVLLLGVLEIARSARLPQVPGTDVPAAPLRALLPAALLGAIVLIGMNRPVPITQWRANYPHLQGQVRVGQWISSHLPPGDQMFVFPAEPEYYFLANRTTTAPYVYVLPINKTPLLMDQLTAQVEAHTYPVIVWQQSGGLDGNEPDYAPLLSTIRANYHMIASYQAPEIYLFVPDR